MDIEMLQVGMRVLYRERSLLPSLDDEMYERTKDFLEEALKEIADGTQKPFAISPGGYIQMEKSSLSWVDPKDLRKRVEEGTIHLIRGDEVFLDDPRIAMALSPLDVLEILPDDFPAD